MFARCVLFCFIGAYSVTAFAWWSPEWSQRKLITIDTTAAAANLQSAQNDAAVLVRLHAGNFPQFLNVRDGAADFRFIAGDDQTPLKYHVESFDPVSQIAMVWVKYPSLLPQSADNKMYLYFGNPAAVDGSNSGATYDVNASAILHFSETTGLPQDSTAYANQTVSGEAFSNPASIIGKGALLAGTAPLVMAAAPHLDLNPATGQSYQLWIKIDELPSEPSTIIARGDNSEFALIVDQTGVSARFAGTTIGSTLTPSVWHHLAVTLAASEISLYLDGAKVATNEISLTALGGPIYIGGASDNSGLLSAAIDELRIDSRALSAEEVGFAAGVQGERNNALVTYGADQSGEQAATGHGEGEAHASHFGIIINNVFGKKEAIVEQLVIGLCGLMMAIAILVMFVKAIALSRARRSTNRFLKAYDALGVNEPLEALVEQNRVFGDSPLFAVYALGVGEVRSRLSPSVGAAAAGLEMKSLQAIRATLDAVTVREGQKLNSMLVLLTIAISGGPFIGLLGTVVGVMVTFAAIAATGDVNITAIAPGMAAALLATVAGLGVAIPALFGYNYLSSKSKDIGADMHVFADEFVARVNERYGV